MTNNGTVSLATGWVIFLRKACPNPFWETTPKRAAISCKTKVAATENNTAHNNVKPKLLPAIVAVVIVPGPMNAAATIAPGPMFLSFSSIAFA
jgi:hypothetical protein